MSIADSIAAAESAVFSALSDLKERITITEQAPQWDNAADKYVSTVTSTMNVDAILVRSSSEEDISRDSIVAYIPHDVVIADPASIRVTIGARDYSVESGNWNSKLPTEPLKLVLKSGG